MNAPNNGSGDRDPPMQSTNAEPRSADNNWLQRCFCIALLAAVPPVVALGFYYGPMLRTKSLPLLPGPDAKLYLYQFARAAQVGGRYWEIAKDETVGKPYPHGLAKHPGFLEGIDLQEIAAVAGRWFGPNAVLHICVLAVMSCNGWIAAYLVRRATGSYFWAALAAVLIVVNAPTVFRVWGNLNLYKHCFVLMAAVAFFDLLDRPSKWRGVWLGVACALILQSSFYYAFLTNLAFGALFLGFLIQGRIGRAHWLPAVVAAACYGALALAFTFPILTMQNPLAAEYFERTLEGVWTFGAELWQYFRPMVVEDPFPGFNYGGANFPGYFILATLATYGFAWARGWILPTPATRLVNRLLLLAAVLFFIGLRGGPGILLFDFVKSFRCFDRGGLIAVGLCCVAAPIAAAAMVGRLPAWRWQLAAVAACAGLVAWDTVLSHRVNWALAGHCWMNREEVLAAKARLMPAWATWLARQPADTRLAAFGYTEAQAYYVDMWHNESLSLQQNDHGHATLNGAEYRLFAADLKMLGAAPERMTPAALRFVASLGYGTIAFGTDFLKAHDWIIDLPWLETAADVEGWRIFRTNATFVPLPTKSLAEIVTSLPQSTELRIPPKTWITERLDLPSDCVVSETTWATLEWLDSSGRRVGKRGAAFGQRIFGPDLPGIRFLAPAKAGAYRLRVSIAGQPVAEREYVVDDCLERAPGQLVSAAIAGEIVAAFNARLVLANESNQTIRARSGSAKHPTGFEYHPTMNDDDNNAATIVVRWRDASYGPSEGRNVVSLPCDLPPGGSVALPLRERLLCGVGGNPKVFLTTASPPDRSKGEQGAVQSSADSRQGSDRGEAVQWPVAALIEPPSALAGRIAMPCGAASFPSDCVDVIVGDFDGDGQLDKAARSRSTGQWFVQTSTDAHSPPTVWGQWSPNSHWTGIVAGDFDGDGRADLCGRDRQTGALWVSASIGGSFVTRPWAEWSNRTRWNPPLLPDLDGDGRVDLVAVPKASAVAYAARSAPDLLLHRKKPPTNFSRPAVRSATVP